MLTIAEQYGGHQETGVNNSENLEAIKISSRAEIRRRTIATMTITSSHPKALFIHVRTYTRGSTNNNADIVNASATARRAGPLSCGPPGGGGNRVVFILCLG